MFLLFINLDIALADYRAAVEKELYFVCRDCSNSIPLLDPEDDVVTFTLFRLLFEKYQKFHSEDKAVHTSFITLIVHRTIILLIKLLQTWCYF